jgi:metal transporter CNNM
MKAHLKHLGPSNLASKPKQTRYNNVKIKPGPKEDTVRLQLDLTEETDRKRTNPLVAPPQSGVGVYFGRNAASSGVHFLQPRYGDDPRSPEMISDFTQTNPKAIQSPCYGTDGSQAAKSGSQSALGSLRSRQSSRSPNRLRGVVRSGSISENVIDVGGVRKTVLEMTSSSDDADEAGAAGNGKSAGSSSPSLHTRKNNNGNSTNDSDVRSTNRSGDGASSSGGRKNRRRKRKKADEDEMAPLLEGKR